MRCNFYTERYWVTFYEMFLPFTTTGTAPLYGYAASTYMDYLYSSLVKEFPYSRGSGDVRYYYMLKYSKSMNGYNSAATANEHVEEVFHLIKIRYMNEYVFDVSFNFARSWPSNTWESLSNSDLYKRDWTFNEVQEFRTARDQFVVNFYNIMEQTYERYATLLNFYAAKKSQLLDKVESLTRFNDTPQDTGEFSDDEHTTHITSTKNDYDTLMARIDEVDRKYRNLLKDWSSEFECLFIHEESL